MLLDEFVVPAWTARILRGVLDADVVDLALVVLNGEPPESPRRFARFRRPRRDRLLFNLYQRVDARLFRTEHDAFAPEDVAGDVAGVPRIVAIPSRPRPFEHRFDDATIAEIRAARLDVLLRFGFNVIRGGILDVAKYGVWSYHHGDSREYRGSPALFWEMYERNPVSGTMLQVLGDELDAGRVLYRSFSATDRLSLHRGRNAAYWKSAEFVIRCLRLLHERGWEYLAARIPPEEARPTSKPIYRPPTNRQTAQFVARTAAGAVLRQLDKRAFEYRWHVGYRRRPPLDPTATGALPPGGRARALPFRLVTAPPGHWYADPIVVAENGRHHLFVEDFDTKHGRGVIAWSPLGENRAPVLRPVLQCDYHLSYPYVFRWQDGWYMLPETQANGTIELWRAIEFPVRWELDRVLLDDVRGVDPTAFFHDGRFWLFVALAAPGAALDDELWLFHAESPRAPLASHPLNPIVSDVRRARPAGAIFEHDGALVRPSQDGSQRYGGATVFNRITTLSVDDYAEEPVARLDPGWRRGNLATHTFNSDGEYQVVDAQRRSPRRPVRLRGRGPAARSNAA